MLHVLSSARVARCLVNSINERNTLFFSILDFYLENLTRKTWFKQDHRKLRMIVKPLWPLWILGLHTLLHWQRQKEAIDANRSKTIKSVYSTNCSLETREHEAGIASNRKLLHYGWIWLPDLVHTARSGAGSHLWLKTSVEIETTI